MFVLVMKLFPRKAIIGIITCILGAVLMIGCKNDNNSTASLSFSRDTVLFDTTFAQLGSSTEVLLLRNTSSFEAKITSVRLEKGSSSKYRMNVDGEPGYEVRDLIIPPNDSIYIFLKVTIDPLNSGANLVEEDKVIVEQGSTQHSAVLVAMGADANYIYPTKTLSSGLKYSILPCNAEWNSSKPIVVIGYAVVDSACSLTIRPGTQVYFWRNGGLWIFKDGNLQVLGEKNNRVIFSNSRLGAQYQDDPGSWDRIFINEGEKPSLIRNAVIRNGFIGIQAQPLDLTNIGSRKLILDNVEITNMSGVGLLSRNFNIDSYNSLYANCGNYCVALTFGGNYNFKHNTIANYWRYGNRSTPALLMGNAIKTVIQGEEVVLLSDLNANIQNSIVYGTIENEFGLDSIAGAAMNFKFENSLIKVSKDYNTNTGRFINLKKNQDPLFVGSYWGSFLLNPQSPAINHGNASVVSGSSTFLMFDPLGVNRTIDAAPDAGVYERK